VGIAVPGAAAADEPQCGICFETTGALTLTSCNHPFHYECIRRWLTSRGGRQTCPTCVQLVDPVPFDLIPLCAACMNPVDGSSAQPFIMPTCCRYKVCTDCYLNPWRNLQGEFICPAAACGALITIADTVRATAANRR
jgi:hypothetical protein